MEFLVFSFVGIAAALLHVMLPGEHHVGPISSLAVGVTGGWSGALLASAFILGGWASFGLLALAGSIAGAVVGIEALELAADAYLRSERRHA
jgi:uncharacterized membrane protein YeaQ/YmgE (transglycosylase-associated protein family)